MRQELEPQDISRWLDQDGYLSSHGTERVKLIAETRKGLLVGGQIVARENAAPGINMLMLALRNRMPVANLGDLINRCASRVAPLGDSMMLAVKSLSREIV